MPDVTTLPESLRFGRFELRAREHRLLADGEAVPLGGRAFDLLLALVQRSGQLASRSELIEQVWPGRVVEENNLSVQINTLRKVLGGELLVTVPGRGYRLVASPSSPALPAPPAASASPSSLSSSSPSPSPSVPGPRTHLPVLQPLLIGRSDDLAALGTLVDQHRLVTVAGAGGMGKTRLAQALLHLRAHAYEQGVCWVELGQVTTPEALPATVAAALALPLPPGDALPHLARAACGLHMLVALDNAEHLLDDVAKLAQALLDAAPGLRLVVTSQAPLRLASERVLRLGPLALPQGTLPAQEAQTFGAVALFCERAAAADHRFELSDADVPAVIELCRRLDGLALAIELAAGRAPTLGLPRLLEALSERLQVFKLHRNRLAPSRHQSLRATLEWSVSLLSPPEQRLFRRLGVLGGSATLDLVQRLGSDAQDGAPFDWDVVDALDQLVQRSLVEVVMSETTAEGQPRYRLLESPRALALELLSQTGEEQNARHRHAQAVLEAFEKDERELMAGKLEVARWRRDGEPLFGDVHQALRWADAASDRPLALGLAAALLSRLPDSRYGGLVDAVRVCETLIDAPAGIDPRLVCQAWLTVSLATFQGPQRSQDATSRALQRLQTLGTADEDRFIRYATLYEAARVRATGGHREQAEQLLAEAQRLEDPHWPPVRLRTAPRARAFVAMANGQPDVTLHHLKQALALSLAAGDPSLATRLNIADMELDAGRPSASVQSGIALVQALSSHRAAGLLQLARLNLATAHLHLRQVHEARQLLQATWQDSSSQGNDWPELGQYIDILAWMHTMEGHHQHAARLVGAADVHSEDVNGERPIYARQRLTHLLGLLREHLDDDTLTALRQQGRALSEAHWAMPAQQSSVRPPHES
jgi:predicted ATPase/DNA-binding winged helix-turn-helix (wHTH) protein